MAERDLGDIAVVLGDPKSGTRRLMRGAMTASGYRDIRECPNVQEIENNLISSAPPDLIITDTEMPGGDIFSVIDKLRRGVIGSNPFVPVIMLTWDANADIIRKAAGCGADDILVAPISPSDLFGRIKTLVARRKPFVVTSDYIGPDRRQDAGRDGPGGIPLIEVPNTLRSKAMGESVSDADLKTAVGQVMTEINDQRLVRHSYQINFLVGLILPAYQEGKVTPEIRIHVTRLSGVSAEIEGRLAGSRFEHVGELSRTMSGVANSIQGNWREPNIKDVELLKPLSQAILNGFNPEKDSSDMAGEINSMVSKFSGKVNEEARREIEAAAK
jgi:DNA-binding response OmpR family regulator